MLSLKRKLVPTKQSGFTLLEVLIAVLVFSIGLLGVAAMILTSMRGTHTAQLRTQATLQSQWIADAMRGNADGVMAGNYNVDPVPTAGSTNCDAGCTAAQTATRDLERWGAQLAQLLPSGTGGINCRLNSPLRGGVPAFPVGLCTVTMRWTESDETQDTGASGSATSVARKNQQFVWVFNP